MRKPAGKPDGLSCGLSMTGGAVGILGAITHTQPITLRFADWKVKTSGYKITKVLRPKKAKPDSGLTGFKSSTVARLLAGYTEYVEDIAKVSESDRFPVFGRYYFDGVVLGLSTP